MNTVLVLLDQNVPKALRRHISVHRVVTAYEAGWSRFSNGALLAAAEMAGYELMITADQNLRHQQNLSGSRIAILVLPSNNWPRLRPLIDAIRDGIDRARPGTVSFVPIR